MELFLEVSLARQTGADRAHGDDDAALARELAGQFDGLIALRVGGDEDGIGAVTVRGQGHVRGELRGISAGPARAESHGQLRALRVRIDAGHAAAGGAEQLHGEKPEEAETDDGHGLAELRSGEMNAVQRDRSERGEGGLIEAHVLGDHDDEVARDGDDLRVHGNSGARAGDAVADANVGDAVADGDDLAGRGVAERHRLVEAVAHGLERVEHAVPLRLLDGLADEVGTGPRLFQQVRLREPARLLGRKHHLAGAPLRPGGDEARARAHQDAAHAGARRRDVDHLEVTAVEVLNELFHARRFVV